MPLLVDICCGRGGWSAGFIAEGWSARGYDLKLQPEYPGEFVQRDLMDIKADDLIDADYVTVSTPCENFSVHCMPHFHPNPPPPELGLKLFNHARRICEDSGKPYIMENVRCAERFVGKAVNHCGPFYLWGNAVPAIFPPECYAVLKNMDFGGGINFAGLTGEEARQARRKYRRNTAMWTKSRRKEASAMVATIPLSISRHVAQCAGVLLND